MTALPPHWPPPPTGSPPPTAERIAYNQALMTTPGPDGQPLFERGQTWRTLAVLFGITPRLARSDATSAAHIVRAALAPEGTEALRAECVNRLRRAGRLAEKVATKDPIGAGKLLVAVAGGVATVTGCAAPKRAQVQVSGAASLDWLTEEVEK